MITLLLVDDDPIIRRGLRMRLALEKDFQVVGEANDGAEALVLAERFRPNVVVMDVVMLGMDGIAATAAIRTAHPETAVVVLSLHADQETRDRAQTAGATAYITKGENEGELVQAIRLAGRPGVRTETNQPTEETVKRDN